MLNVLKTWCSALVNKVALVTLLKKAVIAAVAAGLTFLSVHLGDLKLSPTEEVIVAGLLTAVLDWLHKTTVIAGAILAAARKP